MKTLFNLFRGFIVCAVSLWLGTKLFPTYVHAEGFGIIVKASLTIIIVAYLINVALQLFLVVLANIAVDIIFNMDCGIKDGAIITIISTIIGIALAFWTYTCALNIAVKSVDGFYLQGTITFIVFMFIVGFCTDLVVKLSVS